MSAGAASRHPVAWGHVALIGLMAAGVVAYLWETLAASRAATNLVLVPAVSVVTLALLAAVLVRALLGREPPAMAEEEAGGEEDGPAWHTAAYLGLLTLYVLLLEVAGFDLATFLFVLAALLMKGERRPSLLLGYGLSFAVLCTWAFKAMIPYPMPTLLPYP